MYLIMRIANNLIYVKYVTNGNDISRVLGNLEFSVLPENIFAVQPTAWPSLAKNHVQDKFIDQPKEYLLVLNAEKFFTELKSL